MFSFGYLAICLLKLFEVVHACASERAVQQHLLDVEGVQDANKWGFEVHTYPLSSTDQG